MQVEKRFSVAQIGARMHYAVPRILHDAGALGRLYTDLSVDHGLARLIDKIPGLDRFGIMRKFKGRRVHGVPRRLVTAFNMIGVSYALKLRRARNERERLAVFLWMSDQFARSVTNSELDGANVVYGFNTASAGIFTHARSLGIHTVLEQTIAPKRVELEILGCAKGAGDEAKESDGPELYEYIQREEEEWALADTILCASEFVRAGLLSCGVPRGKCIVVPYGVDLSSFRAARVPSASAAAGARPVRVLFVGGIGLRKGVWTLLAAMRQIRRSDIECRVVGPFVGNKSALFAACPDNVQMVGPVPRADIANELHQADIFCLPSLCEGSATVIYEALAAGVPVVTTDNAGSIVRHGEEGLVVPAGDKDALASALLELGTDAELRAAMSRRAVERSEYGSMSAYSTRLLEALGTTPCGARKG